MNHFIRAAARILAACLFFALAAPTYSQTTTEINRGLQWLTGQLLSSGTIQNESLSVATPFQNRAEVLQSLSTLASTPSTLADSVMADTENNTEYLSRQIIALSSSGKDLAPKVSDLLAHQNTDGGFGGAPGYESNPLDTAFALLALKSFNTTNLSAVQNVVAYLLQIQDANGGFSMPGNSPDTYVSSLVSSALQVGANTIPAQEAVTRVNGWLLSQQMPDGGWGNAGLTSLVYVSLLGTTSDAALQSRVVTYLVSKQGNEGSWQLDPYMTALALRALAARPGTRSTTGSIAGQVVDAGTGLPITGASVLIQQIAGSIILTDSAGKFAFNNVIAGTYALTVSSPGYTSRSENIQLQAGVVVELGALPLSASANTGIVQGTIRDSKTGNPLSGVTVSISGSANATAVTQADGSYKLTGLPPGQVTFLASATGYDSVGGNGTIAGGTVLIFSPSMKVAGTSTDTTGTIVGQVIDLVSQAPLAGVTVSANDGWWSTVSGSDGRFALTGVTQGAYHINLNRAGYVSKLVYAFSSGSGVTDLQRIDLGKNLDKVVVVGKVIDATSKQPLAKALVTVLGTSLSAITDSAGSFRVEGIPVGSATLRYSALGYTSEAVLFNFNQTGEYRADRSLLAGQGAELSMNISTDKPTYSAYMPVVIHIHAENNGGQGVSGTVGVTILNEQGGVVDSLVATRTDASGTAMSDFDFPPGSTTMDVTWNTLARPPGRYSAVVRINKLVEGDRAAGVIQLTERQIDFAIEPTQAIERVTLTPLPSYANIGANEQIGFRLDVINRSNVAVTSDLSYQLSTPGSAFIYGATTSIQLDPTEGAKSILLNGFHYQFLESGTHTSTVTSTGGVAPAFLEGRGISVAPGTRIDPTQSIAPTIVTPDGDKRIRVDIKLQGVEQK